MLIREYNIIAEYKKTSAIFKPNPDIVGTFQNFFNIDIFVVLYIFNAKFVVL